MEPGWAIWADTTIHESILIVTDQQQRLPDIVQGYACGGRFVLACASDRVAQVLALARFDLIVVLDDIPFDICEGLARVFAERVNGACEVLHDALPALPDASWPGRAAQSTYRRAASPE